MEPEVWIQGKDIGVKARLAEQRQKYRGNNTITREQSGKCSFDKDTWPRVLDREQM